MPAGLRSAAASWPASRRPPRTRCCGARSAVRSCCGSRDSSSESGHRGRRRVARQPRAGRLRRGGVDRGSLDRARRDQAGHRPRDQQRRRIPRSDSRFGRRREAGRHRGRGLHGFQAGGRADVRAVESQTPRPRRAARPGPKRWRRGSSGSATRGSRVRATRTPTDWPTRRWTPRPASMPTEPVPAIAEPRENRCEADTPDSARLDRRARHPDPAAVAAARADRVVGAAPLFGPRQPGADRSGPAAGGRCGAVSGAARRDRRGVRPRHCNGPTTPRRRPPRRWAWT